jgi:hypothetical protein
VDGTGSGSCPVARCVSGDESSGSATIGLIS